MKSQVGACGCFVLRDDSSSCTCIHAPLLEHLSTKRCTFFFATSGVCRVCIGRSFFSCVCSCKIQVESSTWSALFVVVGYIFNYRRAKISKIEYSSSINYREQIESLLGSISEIYRVLWKRGSSQHMLHGITKKTRKACQFLFPPNNNTHTHTHTHKPCCPYRTNVLLDSCPVPLALRLRCSLAAARFGATGRHHRDPSRPYIDEHITPSIDEHRRIMTNTVVVVVQREPASEVRHPRCWHRRAPRRLQEFSCRAS